MDAETPDELVHHCTRLPNNGSPRDRGKGKNGGLPRRGSGVRRETLLDRDAEKEARQRLLIFWRRIRCTTRKQKAPEAIFA
ncbi:hypothetical protein HT118_21660 [Escherichia coli]|nr:hypothetical protein [Escherichia coli]